MKINLLVSKLCLDIFTNKILHDTTIHNIIGRTMLGPTSLIDQKMIFYFWHMQIMTAWGVTLKQINVKIDNNYQVCDKPHIYHSYCLEINVIVL